MVPGYLMTRYKTDTYSLQNLNDPILFTQSTLAHLRALIDTALSNAVPPNPDEKTDLTPNDHLVHFSPLPSFRRIVLTFTTTPAAIHIRSMLDGTTLGSGDRIRVFFGAYTAIDVSEEERHLQAPKSSKQFFISPPPSPPAGWTSKEEDPPNKDVHAHDLASALGRLGKASEVDAEPLDEHMSLDALKPAAAVPAEMKQAPKRKPTIKTDIQTRERSDSWTIVYDPEDQGHSPLLPTVAVEDTTATPDEMSPTEGSVPTGAPILAHTARPPVELMH